MRKLEQGSEGQLFDADMETQLDQFLDKQIDSGLGDEEIIKKFHQSFMSDTEP